MHNRILIILLHYHLAGDLVLINCQNVINYVKVVMYIQFSMLTWYKILVILFYSVNKYSLVEILCMYVMQM